MERIFYTPNKHSKEEILEIMQRNNKDELIKLGIAVGLNYPDWKFAQDICLKLAENEDPQVRANSIFGLAHIARTKGKLEKHLVKAVVLRELRENENRSTIIDAIKDINQFLGWNMGLKLVKKFDDQ